MAQTQIGIENLLERLTEDASARYEQSKISAEKDRRVLTPGAKHELFMVAVSDALNYAGITDRSTRAERFSQVCSRLRKRGVEKQRLAAEKAESKLPSMPQQIAFSFSPIPPRAH